MLIVLIRAALALSIALFGAVSATPSANAAVDSSVQQVSQRISYWQYNYYHNYFTSSTTCNNRGYAMLNYDQIYGMIDYRCHKNAGESKWSMDVLWRAG